MNEPLSAAAFKDPGRRRKKVVQVEPKQSPSRRPVHTYDTAHGSGLTKPHRPDQGEW